MIVRFFIFVCGADYHKPRLHPFSEMATKRASVIMKKYREEIRDVAPPDVAPPVILRFLRFDISREKDPVQFIDHELPVGGGPVRVLKESD